MMQSFLLLVQFLKLDADEVFAGRRSRRRCCSSTAMVVHHLTLLLLLRLL